MKYIFLQARMSSNRLPGKVLRPILGKPMLYHQLVRLLPCSFKDYRLVVLTSREESDDDIEYWCNTWGIDCFRGSLDDVLKRFVDCAKYYNVQDDDLIIRITGDCPLLDSEVIERICEQYYELPSFAPITQHMIDGLDVEVFKCVLMRRLNDVLPEGHPDREHVISCANNRNQIHFRNWTALWDKHLSVDTESDYKNMCLLFEHFGNNNFTIEELVKYFETQGL